MSGRTGTLLVGLFALVAAACSSQPLPLSAQAGSTVGIAVGGEVTQGSGIGYGGKLLRDAGIFDDQRGELGFVLIHPTTLVEYPLETQLVTRSYPDPASDTGIANQPDHSFGSVVGIAQALAIVNIPPATPPGTYNLSIRRTRRASPTQSESLSAVLYTQQLTVLPGSVNGTTGAPNPPTGFQNLFSSDVTDALRALYPHPKLVLVLSAGQPPAAAHIVLTYPAAKLAVLSVFEEQHLGRGSIVTYSDDPVAGQLTIDFADPNASVASLALVFELTNPFGAPPLGGRAATGDFTVVSSTLYDANGAVLPGSVTTGAIR